MLQFPAHRPPTARLTAAAVIAALVLAGCGESPQAPTDPASAASASGVPAGSLVFRQVDAGTLHTCAITPAGEAWCWGSGSFGELGDGKSPSGP